jgi:Uma2 family endonuclease
MEYDRAKGPAMSTVQTRTGKRIKLDRRSNGMLMTPEEFDAVTDYDERFVYELIRGVLVVSPIPGEAECEPNDELGALLRAYRSTHPQGTALDTTLPERYIAVPGGRRRADRVIWTGLGRLPDPAKDVPAIAAEFVSQRKRDRVRDHEEKRGQYLAAGVQEYWIIDRFERNMTVFRATATGPAELVVKADETYRTPLLPGFELPLARLLELADAWDRPPRRRKRSGPKQSS